MHILGLLLGVSQRRYVAVAICRRSCFSGLTLRGTSQTARSFRFDTRVDFTAHNYLLVQRRTLNMGLLPINYDVVLLFQRLLEYLRTSIFSNFSPSVLFVFLALFAVGTH